MFPCSGVWHHAVTAFDHPDPFLCQKPTQKCKDHTAGLMFWDVQEWSARTDEMATRDGVFCDGSGVPHNVMNSAPPGWFSQNFGMGREQLLIYQSFWSIHRAANRTAPCLQPAHAGLLALWAPLLAAASQVSRCAWTQSNRETALDKYLTPFSLHAQAQSTIRPSRFEISLVFYLFSFHVFLGCSVPARCDLLQHHTESCFLWDVELGQVPSSGLLNKALSSTNSQKQKAKKARCHCQCAAWKTSIPLCLCFSFHSLKI